MAIEQQKEAEKAVEAVALAEQERAKEMGESLLNQRGVFDGMGGKLMQLSAVAPQMNALIGKIGIRKKRDKLILGAVIGVCTTLLLLYAFG